MSGDAPILALEGLSIAVGAEATAPLAAEGVSFDIRAGEVFGLVGESGCGKSICALAIAGLLQPPLRISAGRAIFEGRDIFGLPQRDFRKLRGGRIAMVFQEPMTALNPLMRVGDQIAEMFILHEGLSRSSARRRAVTALEQVQVPSPERRCADFPHQLSGGMRQRVMIAIALACSPTLLIADEPTTALDVTIQAEITELILDLCRRKGTAVLMISHDLGHVADICDRVAVMYSGRIVEEQTAARIFAHAQHPYTQGLVAALPRPGRRLVEGQHPLAEIPGMVPPIGQRPPGCHFAPRCPRADQQCTAQVPRLTPLPEGGKVSCFHHG